MPWWDLAGGGQGENPGPNPYEGYDIDGDGIPDDPIEVQGYLNNLIEEEVVEDLQNQFNAPQEKEKEQKFKFHSSMVGLLLLV